MFRRRVCFVLLEQDLLFLCQRDVYGQHCRCRRAHGDAEPQHPCAVGEDDLVFARFNPHTHERYVAGDDFGRLSIHRGGEAFVIRNREDDHTRFLCVDVRGETGLRRFKAVAGVFAKARGALLPVGNVVDVQLLHARGEAVEQIIVQRDSPFIG